MKRRTPTGPRRVTVVVDTSLRGLGALEAAASLAARRQASLEALFVEDAALFQLAALPFARELDRASGAVRPMSPTHLEGGLRASLNRVRRAVDAAVAQRPVPASVRVARGHYVEVALAAAPSVDALFIWSVRHVAGARRASPLEAVEPRPVCVLYEDGETGNRALDLGLELAELANTPLRVVLLCESSTDAEALRANAEARLSQRGRVMFGRASPSDPAAVSEAVGAVGSRLVLLPQTRAGTASPLAAKLLETLDCPIVLVS